MQRVTLGQLPARELSWELRVRICSSMEFVTRN